MYSLEYANALVPEAELSKRTRPCLLAVQTSSELQGEGNRLPQLFLLDKPLMVVGRDSSCQIKVQDKFVSRYHATLTRVSTGLSETYWVRDGDGLDKPSANGVFINGERLEAARQLHDGDRLRFGTRISSSFHQVRVPTPEDHQRQHPLGDLLLAAGLLSQPQLDSALAEKGHCQMLLGEIVALRGWIHPETVDFLLRERDDIFPREPGRHPIGEYLKAARLLTEEQIVEALRLQKRQKMYFGVAVVQQGYIKQDTMDFFLERYAELDASTSKTLVSRGPDPS
jgi:hypothetical protein